MAVGDRVEYYPVIKVQEDKIIDTNGAGDSFVGGFLSAMSEGGSIQQCVHSGSYCASIVIQNQGCQFSNVN